MVSIVLNLSVKLVILCRFPNNTPVFEFKPNLKLKKPNIISLRIIPSLWGDLYSGILGLTLTCLHDAELWPTFDLGKSSYISLVARSIPHWNAPYCALKTHSRTQVANMIQDLRGIFHLERPISGFPGFLFYFGTKDTHI